MSVQTFAASAAVPAGNVFTPTPLLNGNQLNDDELRLVAMHHQTLVTVAPHNDRKAKAYEAKRLARQLGVSIPPQFRSVETVVGWPGTVCDVLEERNNLEDIYLPTGVDEGLRDVLDDNYYFVEAGGGHLDAYIFGTSFIAVGRGQESLGEPEVLTTFESPQNMTAAWDPRRRRVSSAAAFVFEPALGLASQVTLYLPDVTVRAMRNAGGPWVVVNRDEHKLGRVPVAQLVNRRRPSDRHGRSEITRAILGYTDHAIRTLLGMDIAREFYSAPQRYILGADESAFQDASGKAKTAWETYIGRVLALTRDEDGNLPEVGQFSAASPAPYLEGLRGLAQLVAAEAGLPVSYLGIVTDNPASADAIREASGRLISRAGRRNDTFGITHAEVGRLVLLVRDGELPPEARRMQALWGDPATPTPSAQADRAVKLTQGDNPILPASSDVARELAGLTRQQRDRLAAEERRTAGRAATSQLTAAADAARQDPVVAALAGRQRATSGTGA